MASGQVAEAKLADANADQFFHFISELVKHPADLPVDSLPQDDSQAGGPEGLDLLHPRPLAIEHDSGQQLRRERWIPGPIERHFIFLFDFVARMGQALREVAIVRQDEKAFGLRVEPADIEKARKPGRQEIEDSIARIGIGSGGYKAGGFVQDDVELAFAAHQLAPHFDMIVLRRLRAEVRADTTVDRDPPGGDQFIAMPSRTDTGSGEETVQAHGGEVEALNC